MKRTFFLTLTVILSLFVITSCQDDVSDSLKGTTWEFSVSGRDALGWVDLPANAKASITYFAIIQFTSETEFKISERVKGTVYGESVNEIIYTETGSYTYDAKNKTVSLCIEGCIDGKISKNKLTLSADGETVVLTKK